MKLKEVALVLGAHATVALSVPIDEHSDISNSEIEPSANSTSNSTRGWWTEKNINATAMFHVEPPSWLATFNFAAYLEDLTTCDIISCDTEDDGEISNTTTAFNTTKRSWLHPNIKERAPKQNTDPYKFIGADRAYRPFPEGDEETEEYKQYSYAYPTVADLPYTVAGPSHNYQRQDPNDPMNMRMVDTRRIDGSFQNGIQQNVIEHHPELGGFSQTTGVIGGSNVDQQQYTIEAMQAPMTTKGKANYQRDFPYGAKALKMGRGDLSLVAGSMQHYGSNANPDHLKVAPAAENTAKEYYTNEKTYGGNPNDLLTAVGSGQRHPQEAYLPPSTMGAAINYMNDPTVLSDARDTHQAVAKTLGGAGNDNRGGYTSVPFKDERGRPIPSDQVQDRYLSYQQGRVAASNQKVQEWAEDYGSTASGYLSRAADQASERARGLEAIQDPQNYVSPEAYQQAVSTHQAKIQRMHDQLNALQTEFDNVNAQYQQAKAEANQIEQDSFKQKSKTAADKYRKNKGYQAKINEQNAFRQRRTEVGQRLNQAKHVYELEASPATAQSQAQEFSTHARNVDDLTTQVSHLRVANPVDANRPVPENRSDGRGGWWSGYMEGGQWKTIGHWDKNRKWTSAEELRAQGIRCKREGGESCSNDGNETPDERPEPPKPGAAHPETNPKLTGDGAKPGSVTSEEPPTNQDPEAPLHNVRPIPASPHDE